jgi:hypothetical protein
MTLTKRFMSPVMHIFAPPSISDGGVPPDTATVLTIRAYNELLSRKPNIRGHAITQVMLKKEGYHCTGTGSHQRSRPYPWQMTIVIVSSTARTERAEAAKTGGGFAGGLESSPRTGKAVAMLSTKQA